MAERLRERMGELGLTQIELSRRARVSQSRISELLNSKRKFEHLRFDTVTRLCGALGVKQDFFWPRASQLGGKYKSRS
jgi:transcriptional regulator with XRE-family HTH domain